jgi:hypothetical protein
LKSSIPTDPLDDDSPDDDSDDEDPLPPKCKPSKRVCKQCRAKKLPCTPQGNTVHWSSACTECNKPKICCSFSVKYEEDPSSIMEEQLGMLIGIVAEQRALQQWMVQQLNHIAVALEEQAGCKAAHFHHQHHKYQELSTVLGQIVAIIGTSEDNGIQDKVVEESGDEDDNGSREEEEEEKEMSEKQQGKQWAK